ncbi:MAG: methyl coenzyme M reductase system, component A2 [Halobacteriota archaeon]|nr:methyl coenzyme M reductase system, component A2 [Halobacteriota archaeon]
MPENFLIGEGLTKFFADRKVLDDVDIVLEEGQWLGVIGKSGSGKTALMNALRGVNEYKPTSGTVIYRVAACPDCAWVELPSRIGENCLRCGSKLYLDEVDYWDRLGKDPIASSIYDRVGYMLQRSFALYGELSVIVNMMRIMDSIGIQKSRQEKMAKDLLSRVMLSHRLYHRAEDLSGGEKQRCLFAMTIVKNPFLLFADEPSGTLDRITAEAMHEIMDTEKKRGVPAIINSHFPDEVAKLTSDAIRIKDGAVVDKGKTVDVVERFMEDYEKIEINRKVCEGDVVSFQDLKKYFIAYDRGLVKAVNDLSQSIRRNEIFGIVGVSGSGKSTLTKVLAGFTFPSTGDLVVTVGEAEVDMKEVGPDGKGRATPHIAVLHQEYTLYNNLNVFENLQSALTTNMPIDIVADKIFDVLTAVGFSKEKIEYKIYDYPQQLSEGERQRLAIAKCLMTDPEIVFLDEPTGTADPLTRIELAKSLRRARDSFGQTYIIVSHDMDFVDMVCDRAALMRRGKFVSVGDPSDIVNKMKDLEVPVDDSETLDMKISVESLDKY